MEQIVKESTPKRRTAHNYINNEELYQCFVEWKKSGEQQIPNKLR